ncbi:MAG: NAD-dependent epimerase/dehydratase family protein [Bryobacterales bacterium]|nr:NAD-dependent epimerase/dehydratase family protein [Bryobacterales bacterium]
MIQPRHTPFEAYRGRRAVVTGGLGFIGSNLSLALRAHGAQVVVIDSLVHGCGGSPANLKEFAPEIHVELADIADSDRVPEHLLGADVIFNLASEISHSADPVDASRDLELNVCSQLAFLRLCARHAPRRRVVYTSTRQVYGPPRYLPVDERHPVEPVDFNGVHKHAAAQYHLLMTRLGSIDAVILNLTNVYGPRMALGVPGQGFLAHFLAHALKGHSLRVFGDGRQTRDPLFVEDAVDAMLLAGLASLSEHRLFNIGHPEAWSLGQIAELVSEAAHLPPPRLCPFPENRRIIDIGSYSTDTRLAHSVLGWQAATRLPEGIRRTLQFYGRQTFGEVSPKASRYAAVGAHDQSA